MPRRTNRTYATASGSSATMSSMCSVPTESREPSVTPVVTPDRVVPDVIIRPIMRIIDVPGTPIAVTISRRVTVAIGWSVAVGRSVGIGWGVVIAVIVAIRITVSGRGIAIPIAVIRGSKCATDQRSRRKS